MRKGTAGLQSVARRAVQKPAVTTLTSTQKRDLQLAATHLHFNRGTKKKNDVIYPIKQQAGKSPAITPPSLSQIVCCLAPLMRDPHCNAQDTRALYIPPHHPVLQLIFGP